MFFLSCWERWQDRQRLGGGRGRGRLEAAHGKGHPRDGLVLRNGGALDEVERELVVVEGKGEDGAGGRPGADHEVVDGHLVSGSAGAQEATSQEAEEAEAEGRRGGEE